MIEDQHIRDCRPEQVQIAIKLRGRNTTELAGIAGVAPERLHKNLSGESSCEDARLWDRLAEHLECRWQGDTLVTIPRQRRDRVIEWEGAA